MRCRLIFPPKVFISICVPGLVWIWLSIPETKGLPLEEVAALFGDQHEIMIFSDDIQAGAVSGELVIKDHVTEKTGDDAAGKAELSARHEFVELTT